MYAITSTDSLSYFEDQDCFVSVLLTDQYELNLVRNLAESFELFNEQLGYNWHLMLPYNGDTYELNNSLSSHRVKSSDFNEQLANKIATEFGIKKNNFPAILFLFGEESVAVKVPIDSVQLRNFFETLTKGIREYGFKNNPDNKTREKHLKELILKMQLLGMTINIIEISKKPITYIKGIFLLRHIIG